MSAHTDGLEAIRLEAGENEASDLLTVDAPELLKARGWDWAVWTVIDDVPVEQGIGVCGHRRGAAPGEGWEASRVPAKALWEKGRTDDSEACARWDGHVYVFGSHYGSKDGPLERERQFVARFEEAQLGRAARGGKLELDIARNPFRLHRAVNDALDEFGPDLIEVDEHARDQTVLAARREGEKKGRRWTRRLRRGDMPLNIEGADFRGDGTLLLGLRYPVTADGQPILVELRGVEGLFEPDAALLEVVGFHVLDGIGTRGAPAGVRALRFIDGRLHAITGNLDSQDKGSVLLRTQPEGGRRECAHVACDPPPASASPRTRTITVERVREFERLRRIEGIARDPDGRFWYVSDDDDEVILRYFEE